MTEVFAWRNAAAAAKRRPQQAGDIFTGSQHQAGEQIDVKSPHRASFGSILEQGKFLCPPFLEPAPEPVHRPVPAGERVTGRPGIDELHRTLEITVGAVLPDAGIDQDDVRAARRQA